MTHTAATAELKGNAAPICVSGCRVSGDTFTSSTKTHSSFAFTRTDVAGSAHRYSWIV